MGDKHPESKAPTTYSSHRGPKPLLGGGFKYLSFSLLFGEDFQFDGYFSGGLKPPARLADHSCLDLAKLLTWCFESQPLVSYPTWRINHHDLWWVDYGDPKSSFFGAMWDPIPFMAESMAEKNGGGVIR